MFKNAKKFVSILLCIAVAVGCISSVTVTAAATFKTVPVKNYGVLTNYSLKNDTAGTLSYKDTTYMQSYIDMANKGLTDKTYTNMVTFTVYAPSDGTYAVKPQFTLSGGDFSGYYFVLCVNDSLFYKSNATSNGDYAPQFSVKLKEGINIIRCISRLKDTASVITAGKTVDIKGLMIADTLTAVAAGSGLTLYPNNATYKNYKQEGGSNGVGAAGELLGNARARAFTTENLKIGDIHRVPYFSFTVTVAQSGYYDMSLSAYTGSVGATGKVMIFVDAQKYVKAFTDYTSSGALNASVYIPAGTHTVSVTSVYDWKSADGATVEYYRSWSNYYSLKFSNGTVSLASVQNEPSLIFDPSRLEAETYGTCVRAGTPKQSNGGASGKMCAGDFPYSWGNMQSFASLTSYFDKSNTASVSYSVYAPKAGTYTFTPVYYVYINRDAYYMTVLINDTTAKKVGFVDGGGGFNSASFEAELVEGVNIIRFIIATNDNASVMSGNYVNFDCLDIDPSLTGYADAERIEVENAKYINKFATIASPAIGGETFTDAQKLGINTSNVNLNNTAKLPYFAYSLTAPCDGYFDISLLFRAGYNFRAEEYYFAMIVDGVTQLKGHRRFVDGTNTFDKNIANMTVYLTKGSHDILFSAQIPKSGSSDGFFWNDFDALVIKGGLTVSEHQVFPANIVYQGETAYVHNMQTIYNNTTTYSGNAFAGIWNTHYSEDIDDLSTYIDPNTGYTVFTVVAPYDGDYKMKVRFKFGCNVASQYDEFIQKHGTHPYCVLVANGETYKIPHPTQVGWISDAEPVDITLKEGVNTIYAMAPTAELAKEFTNPYIEYDCITMPCTLSAASPSYYTLGDINSDEDVNLKDLLCLKRHIANNSVSINKQAANFGGSKNYSVTVSELKEMRKMLMTAGTDEGAKYGGVQVASSDADYAYDGRVAVDNSKIYYSPYNWVKGEGYRLASTSGAYIKTAFTGTKLGIKVDLSRLGNIPLSSIYVHAYIDGSTTAISKTLANADINGNIVFSTSLSSGNHYAEIYLSGSDDNSGWFGGAPNALRILELQISSGAKMLNLASVGKKPSDKKIIFYGDSITEGVGTGNNDEKGYAPTLAKLLGMEYGQCGNSGSSWIKSGCRSFDPFYIPADKGGYWRYQIDGESRFVDNTPSKGYSDGTPDAVFVNLGENDASFNVSESGDMASRLTAWLADMRVVVPATTEIFVIVPFNYGGNKRESYATYKTALYNAYNAYVNAHPSDKHIHLIDLGTFGWETVKNNSSDQIHPNQNGAKILGTTLAEYAGGNWWGEKDGYQASASATVSDGKVSIYDEHLYWSPFNWYDNGQTKKNVVLGGYVKIAFTGSYLGIQIDKAALGTFNGGDNTFHTYIDNTTSYTTAYSTNASSDGVLTLASGLSSGTHYATVYVANTSPTKDAWSVGNTNAMIVKGLRINAGEKILTLANTPIKVSDKTVLVYGDSITEGYGVLNSSGGDEKENGYAYQLARNLGAEGGIVADAGIGWVRTGTRNVDKFYYNNGNSGFWRYFSSGVNRFIDDSAYKGFTDGCPDALFINMGTNDSEASDMRTSLAKWLASVRTTLSPDTEIFVIMPFRFGGASYTAKHDAIVNGINDYTSSHSWDKKVYLLDLGADAATLVDNNSINGDKTHPNKYASTQLASQLAELTKNKSTVF